MLNILQFPLRTGVRKCGIYKQFTIALLQLGSLMGL